jgi:two-component system, LytTR family, response regulator
MSWRARISASAHAVDSAPLSVLIVDDEPIARRRVRLLLTRDPQIRIVGECASVAQCERLDANIVPNLIFLDVRMPERDGFDLLESFRARGIRPFVIFVTAYSRYAANAFDAGAIDYLLKPFDDDRFAKALERAKTALLIDRITGGVKTDGLQALMLEQGTGQEQLLVSEDSRILFVSTRDIELIQVTGKHVKIFVQGHCYLTRQSLRSVEERLDKRRFVRVHRSTIINVEQIVELHPLLHGDCEVVLKRRTRVAVSRRFRRRLQPFLVRSCGFSEPEERHSF